jgi:hypothetical protein
MSTKESAIRDELAGNLSVLERGLILIERESPLTSRMGAGGRIDILAKDEFGNYVIIEIKRSDHSAREALHQIFKYTSILQHELGIKPTRLRVILVATDWHELRLPFSTYVVNSICHTTGYQLNLDTHGRIASAERIKPIVLSGPLQFSKTQLIYLYERREMRDVQVELISRAWTSLGISDHVLVKCDYGERNREVIYPFGIYMLLSSSDPIAEERAWDRFGHLDIPHDSAEAGGPDTLAAMLQTGWLLSVGSRAGRLDASTRTVTDRDLLDIAVTFDRASQNCLSIQATPRFGDQWVEFRQNLTAILAGNTRWSRVVPLLLDEIEKRDNEARISFYAYNLADTAVMLDSLSKRSIKNCPSLEIVSSESDGIRMVASRPVWTGRPILGNSKTFFDSAYGSFSHYIALRYSGDLFRFDDQAREAAELNTPILESWQPLSGTVIATALTAKRGRPRSQRVFGGEQTLLPDLEHEVRFLKHQIIACRS